MPLIVVAYLLLLSQTRVLLVVMLLTPIEVCATLLLLRCQRSKATSEGLRIHKRGSLSSYHDAR